jgi:uncharacterized membrane protein
MLRGFIVVIVAGLAVTFLKRILSPSHYIGIVLVTSGVVFLGIVNYFNAKKEQNA